MLSKLHQIIGIVLLLASGSVAACNPLAAAVEPDKVSVQLSWFHTVEFVGFYVAEQQGYYAAENLMVTLLPGGPDILPAQTVAEGKADFGVTGGDSLLIARAEGLPLKAIGTIYRHSPVVFMSLAEANIKTPQELVGKRVGVISPKLDNTNDIQFVAMLQQLGIDLATIEIVPTEDYSVGSLTSGAMEVYSGFSTNEVVDAQQKGLDVNLIFPQDYGVLIYANILFTRQQLLDEKPDLAQRFIRATLRGYQYAVEHPDETAALALQYDQALDKAFQQASMQAQIPLIDTGDAPIGLMDEAVWQGSQDILLEQKFIATPVDLETLYTNEFVEKAQ